MRVDQRAAYQLPFAFDETRLRQELAAVGDTVWRGHHKGYHYEGSWTAIALRSRTGSTDELGAGDRRDDFRDTPLMDLMPYVRDTVLASFPIGLRRVRLMRLEPGSRIREHVDSYSPTTDEVRFHVPIVTNSSVRFVAGGRQVEMRPGECWYLDVNAPHSVANDGTEDRIHLVIDCEADGWIRSMLPFRLPSDRPLWAARHRARAISFALRDAGVAAAAHGGSALAILARKARGKVARSVRARG